METSTVSAQKRREILEALRRGTVPRRGLEELAVGLGRFETTVDEIFDDPQVDYTRMLLNAVPDISKVE